MILSEDEVKTANERGEALLATMPVAVTAYYDQNINRVVVELSNGFSIAFRPQDVRGLEQARPDQLNEIEISPPGLGLHFPTIDANIYVPSLLEDLLSAKKEDSKKRYPGFTDWYLEERHIRERFLRVLRETADIFEQWISDGPLLEDVIAEMDKKITKIIEEQRDY